MGVHMGLLFGPLDEDQFIDTDGHGVGLCCGQFGNRFFDIVE